MKFIVDNNVGKLAIWLRAFGYDTLFINPIDDGDLVRIAAEENRIVLTKDNGIFQRRIVTSGEAKAFFIEGSRWQDQMVQVVRQFELNADQAFTRCLVCNCPVVPANVESAEGKVPDDVLTMPDAVIACCPGCGRFYWKGGHWQRMMNTIHAIMTEAYKGRTD